MTQVDLSQLAVDRTSAPQNRIQLRRHVLTRCVLPGLLIVGFASLVLWSARDTFFPPREVQVIPVLVAESQVQSEGTELFNAAGWIEPRPTAIRIAALAAGVVEKLLVVEDQSVEAGQAVAELVKDDAQLTLKRAAADRRLSEAELERSKASLVAATTRFEQPVHLQAALAEADADLAKINTLLKNLPFETQRAESQMTFFDKELQRNLAAKTSVSDREVDQARTDFETAKAHRDELKDRERSLTQEFNAITQRREALNVQLQLLADEIKAKDEADAMVKAAEARVEQMIVAEAEAQLRLDRMTIRAPVAGRVYQLVGLPGARVGNGVMTAMAGHDGATIVTMYQPQSLQIRVDVRFEDIPKVSLNQPVKINNPALKEPILGTVLFISSEADIQKNTLQVKVAIDSPPDFFKPEMLVDVTFLAPKQIAKTNANQKLRMFVPENFVIAQDGNFVVWVADQSEGVARRRIVQTGVKGNDGMIEVEGLSLGTRIITTGIENLTDGQRINVRGESPPD